MDLPVVASRLRQDASRLITACSTDQRAQLRREVESDVLCKWTYLPGPRSGLVLGDMDRDQHHFAHKLLGCVLSEAAHAQVCAIMATEDVLDRREGFRGRRHSTDFWFLVFGDPDGSRVWAWRLEGHHICIHVTVSEVDVAVAPIFLGCNPAVIRSQGQVLAAPLGVEEELARTLMGTLDAQARAAVVVAPHAPNDIYTATQARPDSPMLDGLLPGLAVGDMDVPARRAAADLLELYAARLDAPLAADLRDRWRSERFSLAWEGSLERGQAHYYRLLSDGFVLEHENAANAANHIHNVMRLRGGDLDAADLLQAHKSHLHRRS